MSYINDSIYQRQHMRVHLFLCLFLLPLYDV